MKGRSWLLFGAVVAAFLLLASTPACRSPQAAPAPVWILVEAEGGPPLDPDDIRLSREVRILRRIETRPGLWSLALHPEDLPRELTVKARGRCGDRVRLDDDGRGHRARLRPWIAVDEPVAQVGYDAPVRLEVRPGCPEAASGRIEWTQVGGPALRGLTTERNGFVLRGRSPTFDSLHDAEVPWGVVPVSPRTRGAMVLEAVWRGEGEGEVRRRVRVAAAPRATGLPSVPLGGLVFLGGEGWEIAERPRSARAELAHAGPLTSLTPDTTGNWQLRDAAGRELLLRAGRYDDTPLDCGRAECHGSAATHARTSPMTSVLARGLEGGLGESYDFTCALGCHSVGEPGLPDGGFDHVLRAGGFALPHAPRADAWDSVPVALQRLGGVGCVACHGPGAIPAPEARWAILRSDVCATCHDAPPRYGHVVAWRGSQMARADADPRTRASAECRGCHTTGGFLARIGVREEEAVPEGVGPLGIACAACHAAHGEDLGVALLRDVPVPPSLDATRARRHPESRTCLSCHAPVGDGLPAASGGALWLASGGSVAGDPVHLDVEAGCLGCHRGGPEDVERGASHGFAVDPASCAPCHDEGDPMAAAQARSARVASRARSLWATLVARGFVQPHADDEMRDENPPHTARWTVTESGSPLAATIRDVSLVIEDPAAGAHDRHYAEALLDAAERALGTPAAR